MMKVRTGSGIHNRHRAQADSERGPAGSVKPGSGLLPVPGHSFPEARSTTPQTLMTDHQQKGPAKPTSVRPPTATNATFFHDDGMEPIVAGAVRTVQRK